jgi:hypothetical protein
MLPIIYQQYSFSLVSNLSNLYKENLPEIPKFKLLIENIKLLFKLPQSNLIVEVAEGERAYKVTLLETTVHKYPFGYFVYLPGERRLDAYSIDSPGIPLAQWKNKKLVFSTLSLFLKYSGINQIFIKLINVL